MRVDETNIKIMTGLLGFVSCKWTLTESNIHELGC